MHHTQDLILTIGSVLFIIALIPSLRGKEKPAFATSLLTGTVLVIFAGVYASLQLWFSATTTLVSSLCWLILAVQKLKSD